MKLIQSKWASWKLACDVRVWHFFITQCSLLQAARLLHSELIHSKSVKATWANSRQWMACVAEQKHAAHERWRGQQCLQTLQWCLQPGLAIQRYSINYSITWVIEHLSIWVTIVWLAAQRCYACRQATMHANTTSMITWLKLINSRQSSLDI